jgi:hypothetical protein
MHRRAHADMLAVLTLTGSQQRVPAGGFIDCHGLIVSSRVRLMRQRGRPVGTAEGEIRGKEKSLRWHVVLASPVQRLPSWSPLSDAARQAVLGGGFAHVRSWPHGADAVVLRFVSTAVAPEQRQASLFLAG